MEHKQAQDAIMDNIGGVQQSTGNDLASGMSSPSFMITCRAEYLSNGTLVNGIRLYGRTAKGNATNILVTKVPCYFFMEDSPDIVDYVSRLEGRLLDRDGDFFSSCKRRIFDHESDCRGRREYSTMRNHPRGRPRTMNRRNWEYEDGGIPCRAKIMQHVQRTGDPILRVSAETFLKKPAQCYSEATPFRKIYVMFSFLMRPLKKLVERQTYELHLNPIARFQVDSGLVGCGWFSFPEGDDQCACSDLCIQMDCDSIPPPLRVCCFDIECLSGDGSFPKATRDPVICISAIMNDTATTLFTSRTCDVIQGVDVREFSCERDMLSAWANFIREEDPDIITGWNIDGFDLPYLFLRAHVLHLGISFSYQGKLGHRPYVHTCDEKEGSKKSYIDGRVIMDAYPLVKKRGPKFRCYKLDAVAQGLGLGKKDDVTYAQIPVLWNSNATTRATLGKYCCQDSQLVGAILENLKLIVNAVELARVSGVTLNEVAYRSESCMSERMILRKATKRDMVIPTYTKRVEVGKYKGGVVNDFVENSVNPAIIARCGTVPEFKGAIVLEPDTGFYDCPVATLDFASLYPSIIQAFNISPDTLVAEAMEGLTEATPNGYNFVKVGVHEGTIPLIMRELLARRRAVKREMKASTNPHERELLNARQLALKVNANAIYGFMDYKYNPMRCQPVASSVTAYGRQMILDTKTFIGKRWGETAKVIYGDTDSCMVALPNTTLEEAMKKGSEMEHIMNLPDGPFRSPNKLEFEKVSYPFLIVGKKTYAAMCYEPAETVGKMDVKGLQCVRRDNFPHLANTQRNFLKLWLTKGFSEAETFARKSFALLRSGQVSLGDLTYTKNLSKLNPKTKSAHVEVAKKRAQRTGTRPKKGTRIPFVYVANGEKLMSNRAEDPVFVKEQKLPLDYREYLKKMKNPFVKLVKHSTQTEARAKEIVDGWITGKRSRQTTLDAFYKKRKTGAVPLAGLV